MNDRIETVKRRKTQSRLGRVVLACVVAMAATLWGDNADLQRALDNTNLTFSTFFQATSKFWAYQTSVTHDGVDAASSGALGNSQTNGFWTTVTGPV